MPKPAKPVVVGDARVPMRDGTLLAADVATVDDGVPRPVVLVRTPYSRGGSRAMTDLVGIARRGWHVVNQDVRGRFDSAGSFDVFHQERHDGADTVAWCAEQPWCDGRVVMTGGSYVGATQWLAALERPPALKAISPLVAADGFNDGWTYVGGVRQTGFTDTWGLGFVEGGARARRRATTLSRDWDKYYRRPDDGELERLFPAFAKWRDPSDKAYWDPIDIGKRHRTLDLPAFHVAGWYDVFCEGSIRNFTGMRANAASEYARASQRLLVGPWTHSGLFMHMTAEMDFGLDANLYTTDVNGQILDWLHDAADGKEVEGGAKVFVMGSNKWVELPSWPPPSTPRTYFLDADGALSDAPGLAGAETYRYDSDDPVPTRGGRALGPYLPLPGPSDQRVVEDRADVLVYTTEPLRRDLTVMGMVTADVTIASDAPSADVVVKVADVWPDGRAFNVVDSIRRTSLTPGRAKTVRVDVGSVAQTFRKGHHIRVHVTSSNFPRFERNVSGTQTVYRGGRAPSSVTLPVV